MRLPRLLALFAVTLCGFALLGCQSSRSSKKDYPVSVVRFMIEAAPGEMGLIVRLPVSGTQITLMPKTYFTEYDVERCEVVENTLGRGFMFQFTSEASRDLYRQTVGMQGRRIVTTLNGVAIGAMRMDRPISEGFIITNVELEPQGMEKLAEHITRTSVDGRKELKKKAG